MPTSAELRPYCLETMGRLEFTPSEAEVIRAKLRELRRVDRDRQKAIRASLRRIGFSIEDVTAPGDEGFTVADFDALVARGTIRISV